MRNFAYISVIIVLVGALAAVLCILLAWYTSNDVDRSMRYILDVMDRATKGGEEQMEESCITGTEFMRISRHFNRMTKRIEESEPSTGWQWIKMNMRSAKCLQNWQQL